MFPILVYTRSICVKRFLYHETAGFNLYCVTPPPHPVLRNILPKYLIPVILTPAAVSYQVPLHVGNNYLQIPYAVSLLLSVSLELGFG